MNAVTVPSDALPMRMPRTQPGWRSDPDSESATHSMSLRSMNTELKGCVSCWCVALSFAFSAPRVVECPACADEG
jgi:hypothetical protein